MHCKDMDATKERDWRNHGHSAQATPRRAAYRLRRQGYASLIAFAVMIMMLWIDGTVAAAESSFEARDVVRRGTIEAGGVVGFAQATTAIGAGTSANRSAVFVLPRVGMVLTDPLGTGWWQGNVEVLLQPIFVRVIKPFAAEGAGGSLVLKYNFLSFGRWMPFWDVSAGAIWTNLAPRIPEQSTQFEFVLQTGPGVHYFMTDQIAWTMGVRLHHVSNANLGDRNTGINAVLPYVGISVFLPDAF